MNKTKVISKGYTIETVSWENDGDNYQTKRLTVETKEEALAIKDLCDNLFINGVVGNAYCYSLEDYEKCYDICKNHLLSSSYFSKTVKDGMESEEMYDELLSGLNYNLLGSSEYYFSRVCESVKIFYSPEDIFLEEVV